MSTRPTLRTDFRAADGEKVSFYMARWINTPSEQRPWSEVTMATVAAYFARTISRSAVARIDRRAEPD